MCNLSKNKSDIKVGYKVLAQDKSGVLYSTFTGQVIEIGKVPPAPDVQLPLGITIEDENEDSYWRVIGRKFKQTLIYNSFMNGKTSAFVELDEAKTLLSKMYNYQYGSMTNSLNLLGYRLVVVRITFENDVYEGTYNTGSGQSNVIAGDTIKSMEVIDYE